MRFAEVEDLFSPPDRNLNGIEDLDLASNNQERHRLYEAYRPLIDQTFLNFDAFYALYLAPFIDSDIVPKVGLFRPGRRVSITQNEYFYEFLLNVVRRESDRVLGERDSFAPYAEPGKITSHDWNPNVLLQVRLGLFSPQSEVSLKRRMAVLPRVILMAWGELPEIPASVTSTNGVLRKFEISTAGVKPTVKIVLRAESDDFDKEYFIDQVASDLLLLGPLVLGHEKQWGKGGQAFKPFNIP